MSVDRRGCVVGLLVAFSVLASIAVDAAGPVARWMFEEGEPTVNLRGQAPNFA